MSKRIHVSVPVSNLERSVAFYSAMLGEPPSKLRPDYANFRTDSLPIHLALVAGGDDATPPGGVHHHGVELESAGELATWRARLDSHALEYRVENAKVCCYAVADKVWVADPDGNPWELWVRTGDAEHIHEPEAADECCAPTAEQTAEPTTDAGSCC